MARGRLQLLRFYTVDEISLLRIDRKNSTVTHTATKPGRAGNTGYVATIGSGTFNGRQCFFARCPEVIVCLLLTTFLSPYRRQKCEDDVKRLHEQVVAIEEKRAQLLESTYDRQNRTIPSA